MITRIIFVALLLVACGSPAYVGEPAEPGQCGWTALEDIEIPHDAPCYTVRVNEPELVVIHDLERVLCDRDLSYDGGACYVHGCHEITDVPAGTVLRAWGEPTVPNCVFTLTAQADCGGT